MKVADNEWLLWRIVGTLFCNSECHNEVFDESRFWCNFPTFKDNLISLYIKEIGGWTVSLYIYGWSRCRMLGKRECKPQWGHYLRFFKEKWWWELLIGHVGKELSWQWKEEEINNLFWWKCDYWSSSDVHTRRPHHPISPSYVVYRHSMCVTPTGSISDYSLHGRRWQTCHCVAYYQCRGSTVTVQHPASSISYIRI